MNLFSVLRFVPLGSLSVDGFLIFIQIKAIIELNQEVEFNNNLLASICTQFTIAWKNIKWY